MISVRTLAALSAAAMLSLGAATSPSTVCAQVADAAGDSVPSYPGLPASETLDLIGLEVKAVPGGLELLLEVADLQPTLLSDSPTGFSSSVTFDVGGTAGVTAAVYSYPTWTQPDVILYIPDETGPRFDGVAVAMEYDTDTIRVTIDHYRLAEFAGAHARQDITLKGTGMTASRLVGASYDPYAPQPAVVVDMDEDFASGFGAAVVGRDGCAPVTA